MQQRLGVLHLISSKAFYGAERVVCELVKQNDHKRFMVRVGLIGAHVELIEAFRSALGDAAPCLEPFPCSSQFDFKLLIKLRSYIIANNICIIHGHGYKSNFYALCARLVSLKSLNLVSSNHNWLLNTIKEKIYKQIDVRVLRKFDKIVAISPDIREQMLAVGIPDSKISLIDNGIDTDFCTGRDGQEKARNTLGLDSAEFVIGSVASLTPEKSHRDLILACNAARKVVPRLKLVLVGDGDQRDSLERLSRELSMEDHVLFAGRRNDVHALYPAFDLFALVSSMEGLPMALLEAMAAWVPAVVTSVGAIPDVVDHGNNGLLVAPGNIDEISAAIILMAQDDDLRAKLAAAGRDAVVSRYSSKRMAQDYERIYLHMTGNV